MDIWDQVKTVIANGFSGQPATSPTLGLSVLFEHEVYGELCSTREAITHLAFDNVINGRACAEILNSLSGDELKLVLRDSNVFVDSDIVSHTVEFRQY